MSLTENITVLGDGAWGTTLACVLCGKGHAVKVWGAFPDYVEFLARERENKKFLPGVKIPPQIEFTSDLAAALKEARYVITAVPSHVMREVCRKVVGTGIDLCAKNFVNVSKGIEAQSLQRMSEIIRSVLGEKVRICVLSGPSHAEEVSRQVPTALVAASSDPELAKAVQNIFNAPNLRVYSSTDVVGVEVAGAAKNVLAIAAGICDGLGLGDNTKAAIITRGLHEMTRLGCAMGARQTTFAGLSGLGDLVVTCMSRHSRNRWFGEQLGAGHTADEAIRSTEKVVEGYWSARSVYELAGRLKIEMPISFQVYDIIYSGKHPRQALGELMERSLKEEELI